MKEMILKNIFRTLLGLFILVPVSLYAQVKKVEVELYYISDSFDASDTTAGRILDSGSKTYRVFVELEAGSKLKKIYGDTLHTLKISSTTSFYNNIDRPSAYFGYLINKLWFPSNPTLALDSWLTIGLATKTNSGVLKTEDADGTFIGGTNNYGGTAGFPGGLLNNSDGPAFVPFAVADGLAIPDTATLSQWLDNGFKDFSGIDTTVFGSVNTGSLFSSSNVFLQQNAGVGGNPIYGNKVLVAQLTTTGEIAFELNVTVQDSNGVEINYIAKGNDTSYTNQSGIVITEKLCPFLVYPPVCGCKDPHFIEYSPSYGCNNRDSCKTPIVFGCMDILACNYDPTANFNISSLCCYPGFCNDRDIGVVCPYTVFQKSSAKLVSLYPNPADDQLNIEAIPGTEKTNYIIYNSLGQQINQKDLYLQPGTGKLEIDVSGFEPGLYIIRMLTGDRSDSKFFVKK